MNGLHEFRTSSDPWDRTRKEEAESLLEGFECFGAGGIRKLLATADQLRVLKLQFPGDYGGDNDPVMMDVVGNRAWLTSRESGITT